MDMMQIGELADRAELSLRTIRHYDEVGLLKPSGRSEGGFRLYTEGDLARLLLIRRMKPLGFTLDEMGELLAAIDAPQDPASARRLADFHAEAQQRREKLARQVAWADEFLGLLEARAG